MGLDEVSHCSSEEEGFRKGVLEDLLGVRNGVITWESVLCFSAGLFILR